jgi:hypothetical protein
MDVTGCSGLWLERRTASSTAPILILRVGINEALGYALGYTGMVHRDLGQQDSSGSVAGCRRVFRDECVLVLAALRKRMTHKKK